MRGPLLFKDIDTPGLTGIDVYAPAAATPRSRDARQEDARRVHRDRQGVGAARPRRRRLPRPGSRSFVPKQSPKPRYIVCNADESEPGTFKDRELMEKNPHLLIEGMVLAGYAIGSKLGYIYLRGEFDYIQTILDKAIAEARAAGLLGTNIAGSGCDVRAAHAPRRRRLHLRRGDGAAVLARRLSRPAAAQAAVPRGRGPVRVPDRGQQRGDADERPAHRRARRGVVSAVGHREEPGHQDPVRERAGEAARQLRGADGPAAARTDRETLRRDARRPEAQGGDPGRLVGAAAAGVAARHRPRLRVHDRGRDVARLGRRDRDRRSDLHRGRALEHHALLRARVVRQVHAVPRGHVLAGRGVRAHARGPRREQDIDLLVDVADNILGKTFCALGDAAAMPIKGAIKHFHHEFEYLVRHGSCPVNRRAAEIVGAAV